MGISENVYINRKALEVIDEIIKDPIPFDDEPSYLRVKIGEIKGVIMFAEILKGGVNDE